MPTKGRPPESPRDFFFLGTLVVMGTTFALGLYLFYKDQVHYAPKIAKPTFYRVDPPREICFGYSFRKRETLCEVQ